MQRDEMLRFINGCADDIVDFTGKLISTPSMTPPGDESRVAAVILEKLDALSLNGACVLSEVSERPNVLFRLRGTTGSPTLLYIAHTDTKPVGEARDQWVTDPLEPTCRDGKLYGLGAADMKAAVAAFIYAAAALRHVGPLRGDLLLALVADEEGGGRYGAEYLAKTCGLKADMALIGEPPGIRREWEYLHIGSRGLCCFNIRVRGTQMHSSLSDHLPSVNASVKLAEVMLKLNDGLKLTFDRHPLSPIGVTVNVGVQMKGGVYFGVYPGSAEFGTDIRTLPGMTRETVVSNIRECIENMQRADPSLVIDFELLKPPLDWIAPTEVEPDLPIVQALARASKEVLGHCPPFSIYPAATDAPKFQLTAGIPTVPAFGAGMISLAHGPNEWVGVQSITDACKIYALAALDVLNGEDSMPPGAGRHE
jgi:acetylornithine deacetylase/succinyl-diaminopimelate desuccinylase-like protein